MTAEPRFVVIRAFTSPIEAHLACSALKGAGIDARLSDIHLVEAQWMFQEDRNAACPRCGSEDTAAVVAGRRWTFLSWLVLGLPLFPVRRRSRCRHCGHVFDLEPGTQNPEP
jgi:DNA-directed RNA polymerase subunit RPC12/RpoP